MKRKVVLVSCAVAGVALAISLYCGQGELGGVKWVHLSSKNGDLPAPNPGTEQTASLVLDVDKDGVNDFVIAERTAAPAVVLYRRGKNGWTKYVIENNPLHIEAGGAVADIDGDGDLDVVFGGDWKSNEVWWGENPLIGNREQGTGRAPQARVVPLQDPGSGTSSRIRAPTSITIRFLATSTGTEKKNWSSGIRRPRSCSWPRFLMTQGRPSRSP